MRQEKRAALLAALVMGCAGIAGATDYYVDSVGGDDANAGTAEQAAWKSVEKVNAEAANLKGGDRVLFRRGGLWRATLRPGSGEKGKPLVYSSYGEGA